MDRRIKISEIASQLGVTATTIGNWIEQFPDLFSDKARMTENRRRVFDPNDLNLLATIAKLSQSQGLNYTEIKERLDAGELLEDFGGVNFGVNHTLVPEEVVRQVVDASQIRSELEASKTRIEYLEGEIEKRDSRLEILQSDHAAEVKELQNKIAELSLALGKAEGRLQEIEKPTKRRWWGG